MRIQNHTEFQYCILIQKLMAQMNSTIGCNTPYAVSSSHSHTVRFEGDWEIDCTAMRRHREWESESTDQLDEECSTY